MVQLSLSLHCTPQTISIHDASPSTPLKLIATIKQTASPFADRPVTILTRYSCLASGETAEDAFFTRAMSSPTIATADPQCPSPLLPLRPVIKPTTIIRVSENQDITQRDKTDGFHFITVPRANQGGHADVTFSLPPEKPRAAFGRPARMSLCRPNCPVCYDQATCTG